MPSSDRGPDASLDGVLVIHKPASWTSHDVVNKVRRMTRATKTGHLGTLDPMATGVLPLVLGRATRLAQFYNASTKTYDAEIAFGYATDTYDAEGTITTPVTHPEFTREQIQQALNGFLGTIWQVPPAVSAKKIGGKKAYELAREGKPPQLPAVAITIHEITLLAASPASVRIRVHCSSGTYIRSLAYDLGIAVGTYATLTALTRTQSGDFTLDQAHSLERIAEAADQQRLAELLIPSARLLPELPAVRVDEVTAGFIRQGRDFRGTVPMGTEAPVVKAIAPNGELLAIGKLKLPGLWHPEVVL